MAKFIMHEDIELYTTHGPLALKLIFDFFEKNQLSSDFKVAGFKDHRETVSSIKDMKMIYSTVGRIVKLSGMGLHDNDIIIYPKQKFMDIAGKSISVENAKSGDLFVSLNGMLQVEYVGEKDFDEPVIFYLLDLENKETDNLYGNNIIYLPIEDGDKANPFFTE